MELKFNTAKELLDWIEKTRSQVAEWEDLTQSVLGLMTLRSEYPLTIRLPAGAIFVGLKKIEGPINRTFLSDLNQGKLEPFRKTFQAANLVAVHFYCPVEGREQKEFLAYTMQNYGQFFRDSTAVLMENDGPFVTCRPGIPTQEVEANMAAFKEFTKAISLPVRFRRTEDYFSLKPSDKRMKLEADCVNYQLGGGPSQVNFSLLEEYPGQGLEKLVAFVHQKQWTPSTVELIVRFAWPAVVQPRKAKAILNLLNKAQLPLNEAKVEVYYALESLQKIAVLQQLEKMHVGRISMELQVARLQITPDLEGYVRVKPKEPGFALGISQIADTARFYIDEEIARALGIPYVLSPVEARMAAAAEARQRHVNEARNKISEARLLAFFRAIHDGRHGWCMPMPVTEVNHLLDKGRSLDEILSHTWFPLGVKPLSESSFEISIDDGYFMAGDGATWRVSFENEEVVSVEQTVWWMK